jgi:hypothetical protein
MLANQGINPISKPDITRAGVGQPTGEKVNLSDDTF